MFPALNIPPADLNLRNDSSGRTMVFDILRNKWVVLTPEEWVRQHFTHMLISRKGYSRYRMANETAIHLNNTSRRCDTVVFDRNRRPALIIEYKAPNIALSQQVFDQIVRYNIVLKARFLIVSNGLTHYCCHINYADNTYSYLTDIPDYDEISKLTGTD